MQILTGMRSAREVCSGRAAASNFGRQLAKDENNKGKEGRGDKADDFRPVLRRIGCDHIREQS